MHIPVHAPNTYACRRMRGIGQQILATRRPLWAYAMLIRGLGGGGSVAERPRGFRRLEGGLAYIDIIEVWTALCEEKGLDPKDTQGFIRFLRFMGENGIRVNRLPVCPKTEGWRGELAQRAARYYKSPLATFVVRTDAGTLNRLSEFKL